MKPGDLIQLNPVYEETPLWKTCIADNYYEGTATTDRAGELKPGQLALVITYRDTPPRYDGSFTRELLVLVNETYGWLDSDMVLNVGDEQT